MPSLPDDGTRRKRLSTIEAKETTWTGKPNGGDGRLFYGNFSNFVVRDFWPGAGSGHQGRAVCCERCRYRGE